MFSLPSLTHTVTRSWEEEGMFLGTYFHLQGWICERKFSAIFTLSIYHIYFILKYLSIALDKVLFQPKNIDIFYYFSMKTYVVSSH